MKYFHTNLMILKSDLWQTIIIPNARRFLMGHANILNLFARSHVINEFWALNWLNRKSVLRIESRKNGWQIIYGDVYINEKCASTRSKADTPSVTASRSSIADCWLAWRLRRSFSIIIFITINIIDAIRTIGYCSHSHWSKRLLNLKRTHESLKVKP